MNTILFVLYLYLLFSEMFCLSFLYDDLSEYKIIPRILIKVVIVLISVILFPIFLGESLSKINKIK